MENPKIQWMRTGGTPNLGHLHMNIYIYICQYIWYLNMLGIILGLQLKLTGLKLRSACVLCIY